MGKLRRELVERRGARGERGGAHGGPRDAARSPTSATTSEHIDDADAVAATLRRQVADLGIERDAHELDAKKSGWRVRARAEAELRSFHAIVSLGTATTCRR